MPDVWQIIENSRRVWKINNHIKMEKISNQTQYRTLIKTIGNILDRGREEIFVSIRILMVKIYWEIGRAIVEYEQEGKERAKYGLELLGRLSADLKNKYGKGFSRSNLEYMRLFYIKYQKSQMSGILTWSHYVELLSVSDDMARSFYEQQCIRDKWSVRELDRQIDSMLFERLALSKDKKGVLDLSKKGQIIKTDVDIIKDPYVLEFLGISENYKYSEKELEQKIIDNLQKFLLELGKGFTFVERQFRMTLSNKHFYVDLVFYHRVLKCFVLIDLKIGEATHLDVGQMNMYLNYFQAEESAEEDNPPIGLILATDKNDVTVKYALGGISNKLFVSKYQIYLPKKEMLEARMRRLLK